MKKIFCYVALLFFALPALALDLTLAPHHYADIMEFWYKKPEPEKLLPLLRTMNENRVLELPENQLFFGAFFSRLLARGELDRKKLLDWTETMGISGARTSSWALHLANIPAGEAEKAGLTERSGEIFSGQLKKTSPRLAEWTIGEPAIVNMFWGAFMADGDMGWVDRIVETALQLNNPAHGKIGRQAAEAAAASLWQYTPRHEKVRQSLENAAKQASEADRKLIESILRSLPKKP